MLSAHGPENALGLALAVGFPNVLNMEDSEHDAFRIAEGDVGAGLQFVGKFLGDVERDGHRPERTVGEAHFVADGFVVGFLHEAGEGREAAVREELQVADLSRREVPGGPIAGLGLDFGGAVGGGGQVD